MSTDYRALCVEILQNLDQYEDGQRVDWDAWRNNARAALRAAAADQVVPKKPTLSYPEDYELGVWVACDDARVGFLAIAAELEAQ